MIERAETEVVYFQDDDVVFRHHQELLDAYDPTCTTAVYAHWDNHCGFGDDMPLVGAGALAHRSQMEWAIARYLEFFSPDQDFLYDCDYAIGILAPYEHVHLPFETRDLAYNGKRLADEPWQRETKLRVCNRARWIRDHVIGPSRTESEPIAV